jgi:hypothetical protein
MVFFFNHRIERHLLICFFTFRTLKIAALFYRLVFSAAENIAIAVLTVEIDKEYPIHDRIMLSMLDPFTTLGYKRKV